MSTECGRGYQLCKKKTCYEAMVFLGNHLKTGNGHKEMRHSQDKILEMVMLHDFQQLAYQQVDDDWEEVPDHVTDDAEIQHAVTAYGEFLAETPTQGVTPKAKAALKPHPPYGPPGRPSSARPVRDRSRSPPRTGAVRDFHVPPPPPGMPPPPALGDALMIGQAIAGALVTAMGSGGTIAPSAPSSSTSSISNNDRSLSATRDGLRRMVLECANTIAEAATASREMATIATKASRACEYEGQKLDEMRRELLSKLSSI